jgi:hypothetical protein
MTFRAAIRPAMLFRLAVLALSAIFLAACTSGDDDNAVSPTAAPPTHPPATAAPGEMSVDDLTGRINAAWDGVTALRVTSSSGPIPVQDDSGTPAASGSYAVETWTAPNNRQITEVVDGTIINEQIYVDGAVFMKGIFVGSAVAPEVGSGTWITLDRDVIPRDTPVGNRVAYLTREPASPFAVMSPELLAQPVRESGTVRVGDRACTLYTFGDPRGEGAEIRYEVALDENDLPCQVIQRAGGFQNSSVYEINEDDIQVAAPDGGTPVAGTPEG